MDRCNCYRYVRYPQKVTGGLRRARQLCGIGCGWLGSCSHELTYPLEALRQSPARLGCQAARAWVASRGDGGCRGNDTRDVHGVAG